MSDDLSIPSPTYRIPGHRNGMDPATRRLALIAGGLGGVLLAVVGGWSVMGHRSTTVPVVQADSRPMRVKPENPGGMQVAGADEDIFSGGNRTGDGKLAPPPEVPAPQALSAPPPAPPVAAVPAPTAVPVPAASPAPAKPVAAKPATAPDKHPAANGAVVQLAAVQSEDAARSEWQRLSKRMPDLFGQHRPAFSKTEHDGHTLWRVRTGGFADAAQATTFCEKVRAKGAGCSVADF
ncbi:MAG TPA: SPOR domain-containing protein [Acetobacteraceae bacterium]|nr:SPOR domain-containing protein [Acetobacteraceae bacterium]